MALTRENYGNDQCLTCLSQQNSFLRKNIIGQLAQQFLKLNAFQVKGETFSIKPQFMDDGDIFTGIMEQTRVFLQPHKYIGFDEKPILIEYTPKGPEVHNSKVDFALPAGILMKTMESLPSFKYLLTNYIPILPLFKDTYIGELFSAYEYPVSVSLYTISAIIYGCTYSFYPIYIIISAVSFAAREPMYKYRAEAHTYISSLEQNGWVKFGLYTGSDTLMLLAIALPFVTITPYNMAYLTISGFSLGTINYYNAQPKDSNVGNLVAFATTTAALAYCAKAAVKQPSVEERVIATEICANILAEIHYLSKVSADLTVDGYNWLMGNSTNIEV